MPEVGRCELCGREAVLTFHHLIPRTLHTNKWFKKRYSREEMARGMRVCRQCHRTLHRYLSEKELGRHYNTREKLLKHELIARYVAWAARH